VAVERIVVLPRVEQPTRLGRKLWGVLAKARHIKQFRPEASLLLFFWGNATFGPLKTPFLPENSDFGSVFLQMQTCANSFGSEKKLVPSGVCRFPRNQRFVRTSHSLSQICQNLSEIVKTCQKLSKLVRNCQNRRKLTKTVRNCQNHVSQGEKLLLEPYRPIV